jgi:pimeloyl-ACP methyl ester carboxylesterase
MVSGELPQLRKGAGAPLVVVPGLSGRAGTPAALRTWMKHEEIADFIGDRTVVSIDRRYNLEAGTSIADIATEYAHTIGSQFDEPVDIMGISTGGTIALQLAADHPELLRRLVLVSSAHRLSDRGRATQRSVAELLRAGHDRRAAAMFLGNTGASQLGNALRSVAGLLAPRSVVGRGDLDLLITLDAEDGFDLDARLETIAARTLIAGGQRDRFYSAELFEHASRRIPNARLALYPGAGHLSTSRNPRLAREILRFLDAA